MTREEKINAFVNSDIGRREGILPEDFYPPQEPTEDFLLEMAADHEFRLCELELFGGIE